MKRQQLKAQREEENELIRAQKDEKRKQQIIDNFDRHKFGEWFLQTDQYVSLTCEYREHGLVCVEGFRREGYCIGCICDAYIEYDTYWYTTEDGIEVELERGRHNEAITHDISYDDLWPYIRTNDEELRQMYDMANDEIRLLWDREQDIDQWYLDCMAKKYKADYLRK